jgi:hypothetical protein
MEAWSTVNVPDFEVDLGVTREVLSLLAQIFRCAPHLKHGTPLFRIFTEHTNNDLELVKRVRPSVLDSVDNFFPENLEMVAPAMPVGTVEDLSVIRVLGNVTVILADPFNVIPARQHPEALKEMEERVDIADRVK